MYSERPGWSRSTRGSRNDDTSLAMRAEGTPMVRARPFLWLRWQLLEDQHREIAFRREIVFANLELRGVDPPYAFGAEAHQAVGVALVDHQAEILDRARPVGAGPQHVVDALLAIGRAELAAARPPRAIERGQEILVETIFLFVLVEPRLGRRIGRAERGLHRHANARLVAVLHHGLGLGRKRLLPIKRGRQRPARRQMLLQAFAGIVFLD